MQSVKKLFKQKKSIERRKFYKITIFIAFFLITTIGILFCPRHLYFEEQGLIIKQQHHYYLTKRISKDPFGISTICVERKQKSSKITFWCQYIYINYDTNTKNYEILNDKRISIIYNFDNQYLNKTMTFTISNNRYYLLITDFFYKFKE